MCGKCGLTDYDKDLKIKRLSNNKAKKYIDKKGAMHFLHCPPNQVKQTLFHYPATAFGDGNILRRKMTYNPLDRK